MCSIITNLILCILCLIPTTKAFVTPSPKLHLTHKSSSFREAPQNEFHNIQPSSLISPLSSPTTSLQMGYNLPPSGGGGGGGSKVEEFITPILIVTGLVLFFISPLGGIFFAITNSLFVLALLTPILLGAGFNVWQYFNTIEGDCPSCGASVRVMKDTDAGPNICLNCGQLVRANASVDGVELCNDPNDIFDEKSRVSSIFDIFTSDRSVYEDANSSSPTTNIFGDVFSDNSNDSKKKDQTRREGTIIDVDVEKD